jgi:hypothetical protein
MGRGITHFMWGYQPHFRINKECDADRIFLRIDGSFKPQIFVVGILVDASLEKFPACVEPEDDFWIKSDDFNEVPGIASRLITSYPENGMFQSDPLAQNWQDEHLRKRSMQDAIKEVIESHPSKPKDMSFYISYPARIDCYWVCTILGLQISVLSAYPSLKKAYVKMHEHRHISVATSFIDAVIDAFLARATEELLRPNPGLGASRQEVEELLRSAGDSFVTGLVWRIDQNCIEAMHGLFGRITAISSLRYEKAASVGRILLGRKDHPSIAKKISFAAPTPLSASRSARKLLELASDDLPLHCDTERIYGLAEEHGYNPDDEDLFEVDILGHHHWELRHSGHTFMKVQYGAPSLPKLPFSEEKFRRDLPRIFREITPFDIDNLTSLVKIAEKESHGTLLVITEAAATQAGRLAAQGTPVSACPLTPEILRHLTSIDGAIVLTPTGVCYAIGTILDGKATQHGDPGRGARFNSAIRYYESSDAPCVIVVVSSDGGVEFVPDPRPLIRRSAVDDAIKTIQGLRDAERTSRRLYRTTLDWLDKHRFYLKHQDCEILNPLIAEIEERIRREGESTMWIVRSPFTPNPAMRDQFYYLND